MLLKKKEKCLSEYVQISVRGLGKVCTVPPDGAAAHPREEGVLVWSHSSQQSSSALHLPGNRSDNGDPGQAAAHTCRPWARGQHPQAERPGGDTHSCWRGAQAPAVPQGRCAAGQSLSACSRPAGTPCDQPWRSTEPFREPVTKVGLGAQKPGITQPNRLHSSYGKPLETAAHPMKGQSQQQTTFLRECLLRASLQPPVRSNH